MTPPKERSRRDPSLPPLPSLARMSQRSGDDLTPTPPGPGLPRGGALLSASKNTATCKQAHSTPAFKRLKDNDTTTKNKPQHRA